MLNRLYATLAAVYPIHGVSGGQGNTRIDFKDEATPEQRTAAQNALSNFDWSQAAHDAWLVNLNPERRDLWEAVAAAVADNNTYLALASPTAAQTTAQVKKLTQQMNRVLKRLAQVD